MGLLKRSLFPHFAELVYLSFCQCSPHGRIYDYPSRRSDNIIRTFEYYTRLDKVTQMGYLLQRWVPFPGTEYTKSIFHQWDFDPRIFSRAPSRLLVRELYPSFLSLKSLWTITTWLVIFFRFKLSHGTVNSGIRFPTFMGFSFIYCWSHVCIILSAK